jgi:hypothetical protein
MELSVTACGHLSALRGPRPAQGMLSARWLGVPGLVGMAFRGPVVEVMLRGGMASGVLQLRVDVGLAPDAGAVELDEAARQLRSELLELDVADVALLAEGPPPPGARAVEAAVVGVLAVTAAREVMAAVVRSLERWVGSHSSRTVKLTLGDDSLELSGASLGDQRLLVESFLAHHATPPT